jgi:hypothetical protein
MKNFLSNADLAIWIALIAGQVILCLCIFEKTVPVSRVRSPLRLESVLQAATCGMEKACESEDRFVRDFDGGFGSGVRSGQRVRRSGAHLPAQPGLSSEPESAKSSHLRTRRALLDKEVNAAMMLWAVERKRSFVAR